MRSLEGIYRGEGGGAGTTGRGVGESSRQFSVFSDNVFVTREG